VNDKASPAAAAQAFDPAAAGWVIQEGPQFAKLVGPVWGREVEGELRLGFLAQTKHANRAGNVHGGMLMTFADQAMAVAARRATGGKRHATIELNIQFVDAVRIGEFVEARSEVVRATRSVVFMQARMFVGPRVVAATNGIWKVLDER
jgi:uncharacterized protein (TIGR00369 family)